MEDQNKINLKNINKTKPKKSLKITKLTNLFKKQNGQTRDELGKFAVTSGSGGLAKIKSFNLKRALPVIIIISLIGGVLVFRSFAATGNEQTVTNMYWSCLNHAPDPGGLAYWTNRLDSGESAWAVSAAFMKAAGVASCPYSSTPRVGTTPAPTISTQPTVGSGVTGASLLNDAKAWVTLADAHVVNAKKENATTYAISLKNPISAADLSTIANKEGYVRGAIKQLEDGVGKVSSMYNQAISNPASRAQGPEILAQLKLLQKDISDLKDGYLVNISNDYARAKATYEANLNFFARITDWANQKADCLAKLGTWNDWTHHCTLPVSTVTGGSGSNACAGVRASSSSTAIQACQRFLGITADGCWGPTTANVFHVRFPGASGWETLGQCAGGGRTSTESSAGCPNDSNEWIRVAHGKKQVAVVYTVNNGKCNYARSVSWTCNQNYGHPTGVNDCYIKSYPKIRGVSCRANYREVALGYAASCILIDDGGRIYTSTGTGVASTN